MPYDQEGEVTPPTNVKRRGSSGKQNPGDGATRHQVLGVSGSQKLYIVIFGNYLLERYLEVTWA